ncbi:bS18 family ribosomal protein [Kitasatospora sp. SUK 42]|uniref:bS18 family ribosomal protein n=1 Tax=Kitasatospora sp. SUK 42 TaxID=1588882 RepID=UPI0018C9FCF8|nr:hypothetical protein [Kitasatospora sp. SUK 42]MBV2155498.1 hypothetical protein [Kitasatospora sp. SUK 42]
MAKQSKIAKNDLLRRFVSDRGKTLPQPSAGRCPHRRVTRLTVQQQRAIARAVRNARETAPLPYTSGTTR